MIRRCRCAYCEQHRREHILAALGACCGMLGIALAVVALWLAR